jgi:hypothetical protein
LLRREPSLTVWRIGDEGAPPLGTLDPAILIWLEENDFILVTNNRKTMPAHLADHLTAGQHVPGILILDLGAPISLALDDLILIALASYENEFLDRIAYIPLT